MVQAMRAFLDFCYIAQRDILDTDSLSALDDALQQFLRSIDNSTSASPPTPSIITLTTPPPLRFLLHSSSPTTPHHSLLRSSPL